MPEFLRIREAAEVAEDYFGQGTYYFSESAGELITIEHMVPQYALNAWNKLYTEQHQNEFFGSPLSHALMEHFMPSSRTLSDVLRQHGTAVVFTGAGTVSVNAARKRLRRAGADETHKRDDNWVEGIVTAPVVKVKRRKERVYG
jgi:hypothetical protein